MINDTLKKMSKMFDPQFFFLHVKKYDKKGKVKYSIRTRFKTGSGTFVTKTYAWDLRDAVNDALNKLERIMKKDKETRRDRVMERRRLTKVITKR
jgi:ribosome-associated translation inhibitor RaiA